MKSIHLFASRTVLVALLAASAIAAPAARADQPHMRAAIASLRQAQAELEAAEHNKGGFRVKAIHDIQRVIDDVRAGMAEAR